MQVVRVGVIGVGGMGTFHARTLSALAGVELVAVADPLADNVDRLVDELGCAGHGDPLELAERTDVDAVVIASPDDTHAELTITALGAGSWVLCEKPLAPTANEAWTVVERELAIGERRVQVGFMREYDPAHTQLVTALRDAGPIHALRLVHRNCNSRRRPLHLIVGQSMVHDLHSVRFVTGEEIVSVRGYGAGAADDSYRHTVAMCRLASGAHAVVEFDDSGFAYEVTVEVLAERSDAITGAPTRAVRRGDGSLETRIGCDWFAWFADAYRLQDQAWIASIRAGRATGPTAWDGFVAQTVVDAVLESLRTDRDVAVAAPVRPALYAATTAS